jgi:hypothetical protein
MCLLVTAIALAVQQAGEKRLDTVGSADPAFELMHNQSVKVIHADAQASAGAQPLVDAIVAGVITVPAALAGADRHAATTSRALGDSGEQCRTVDDAGRCT